MSREEQRRQESTRMAINRNATLSLMFPALSLFTVAVSSRSSLGASSFVPICFRVRTSISSIGHHMHSGASWEEISNPKSSKTVKLFKSIHKANKSRRSEIGATVAEGVRLVTDLLSNEQSNLVRRVVISDELKQRAESPDGDQYQRDLIYWCV